MSQHQNTCLAHNLNLGEKSRESKFGKAFEMKWQNYRKEGGLRNRKMGKWQKNDTWIWVGQNGVSNSNLDK